VRDSDHAARVTASIRYWNNFSEKVVEERREGLHNYIQLIMNVPVLARELYEYVSFSDVCARSCN